MDLLGGFCLVFEFSHWKMRSNNGVSQSQYQPVSFGVLLQSSVETAGRVELLL